MDEYPLRSRPKIKVIYRIYGSVREIIGVYRGMRRHNIIEVDYDTVDFRNIMEVQILEQNE